jgi:hypothetical protein
MPAPIILTLWLDETSEQIFQRARTRWFPPDRNIVPAHITLFHHLDGAQAPGLLETLSQACAAQRPTGFQTTGLRHLGRGVAYGVTAAPAALFRAGLAEAWAPMLTPQDRQPWRPHITIQNKADPAASRALYTALSADFVPHSGQVLGVRAWHYEGGPWSLAREIPFGPAVLAALPPDHPLP